MIAQDQCRPTTRQKCAADQAGLRDPFGCGLDGIMQGQSPLPAIARQLPETGQILFGRDNQDLAYSRLHQRRQRIMNHRLVVHRQHVLRERDCHRIQARARAACQDHSLACAHAVPCRKRSNRWAGKATPPGKII
jgi:hypothetical protein